MRARLHHAIFFAMGLGVVAGLLLEGAPPSVMRWFDLVGRTLFVGALTMIVAPLILFSVVAGLTSISSLPDAGRIGGRTLVYYIATTTVAVTIGLVLVLVVRPGHQASAQTLRTEREAVLKERAAEYERTTGGSASDPDTRGEWLVWLADREGRAHGEGPQARRYARVAAQRDRTTYEMFVEDLVQPMLMNPFQSLAERNSLGIIVWSLFLGLAIVALGARARIVAEFFQAGNIVVMEIVRWLMALSPIAIFCLMVSIVAQHGPDVFATLGWYCGTVVGGIVVHVGFLLLVVAVLGKMSPLRFLRGIREAWAAAFSTRSSAATLPITMRCVTERLGVSPRVANFTLPVGATVNMDGTALYEGVAVIFLLQIYGGMDDVSVTLTGAVTIVVFITAVLASVGAAAVPDAGLVTMVLVASAVRLPVHYIPLIFAVDAFLDMFRTSTNVMGDAVGAVVVDRFESRAAPST